MSAYTVFPDPEHPVLRESEHSGPCGVTHVRAVRYGHVACGPAVRVGWYAGDHAMTRELSVAAARDLAAELNAACDACEAARLTEGEA